MACTSTASEVSILKDTLLFTSNNHNVHAFHISCQLEGSFQGREKLRHVTSNFCEAQDLAGLPALLALFPHPLSSCTAKMDPSRLVEVLPERVGSVSSPHFPHNAPGATHAWSLAAFKRTLQTRITRLSPDRIELDLVGVDASIANAIRRTLMAEVPTVAIENVYVWNNTSIVQDEVLSHRLGLVPLYINPDQVEFKDARE